MQHKTSRVLAIDLGASSGRGIVFTIDQGKIREQEVYRFANGGVETPQGLSWDLDGIVAHIVQAIAAADRTCGRLDGIGIDTWGVDYGAVDTKTREIVLSPRHYRDPRHADKAQLLRNSAWERYRIAGISDNEFNTTYQLMVRAEAGELDKSATYLFMPQLIGYCLTGVAASEATIASTCGFYRQGKGFDSEFLQSVGLSPSSFAPVKTGGSVLGTLLPEIRQRAGIAYDLPVILTCGHDTACAVLAIPDSDPHPLYLSSGTWSLFGTLTDAPICTREAFDAAYTNEIAFDGKVRFLRNIMGMWLIQQCRSQWGDLPYAQIVEQARVASTDARIDVTRSEYYTQGDMLGRIRDEVASKGQRVPQSVGEVAACVYRSMADAYADAYRELCKLTNRTYPLLHVIGGGSQNDLLNQWIADRLGMPLAAGPVEASALGNALGQWLGLGILSDRAELQRAVTQSYPIRTFLPAEQA